MGEQDFTSLKDIVNVFENNKWTFAWDVGEHLFVNSIDIFDDIMSALEAWENKEYWISGKFYGKACGKVAGPNSVKKSVGSTESTFAEEQTTILEAPGDIGLSESFMTRA